MDNHTLLITLTPDDLRRLIREELEQLLKSSQNKKLSIDELLSIDEACEFLKVSRPTLRKLTQSGRIPFQRIGRTIRFNKADILNHSDKRNQSKSGYFSL